MTAPEGIARYIFPIADSQALSGYDILNDPDPETRADVQRAIHTRGIILSPPGTLRQGGFGVTAWEAVYRGQDLWGLVSIAVDMNTVLADAGLTNSENGLNMALRNASSQTFFGPETLWQVDPVIQKIVLPDGAWELGGAPSDGWDSAVIPEDLVRNIMAVGTAAECRAKVREYVEAGVTCPILYPLMGNIKEVIDNYSIDNYWCMDPKETIGYMSELRRPWIAYKVLAAGAIHPRAGFQHAFDNGADFIAVGMFDFQISENVAVTQAVLKTAQNREREWFA